MGGEWALAHSLNNAHSLNTLDELLTPRLSQGGLFSFAAAGSDISASNGTSSSTTEQYSQGFQVAEQLVSVAIGLTVGLFVAAVVTHPLGGSRRRGAGIFSF